MELQLSGLDIYITLVLCCSPTRLAFADQLTRAVIACLCSPYLRERRVAVVAVVCVARADFVHADRK